MSALPQHTIPALTSTTSEGPLPGAQADLVPAQPAMTVRICHTSYLRVRDEQQLRECATRAAHRDPDTATRLGFTATAPGLSSSGEVLAADYGVEGVMNWPDDLGLTALDEHVEITWLTEADPAVTALDSDDQELSAS